MDTNHDISQAASRSDDDGSIQLDIDNLSQLAEYANPNCKVKTCGGRGYTGFFQENGSDRKLPMICKCVKNLPRK